jgi:hypothetical protein
LFCIWLNINIFHLFNVDHRTHYVSTYSEISPTDGEGCYNSGIFC